MQIQAERWHQAIQIRRSRRSFMNKSISEDLVTKVHSFLHEFRPFGDSAYGVLITETPEAVFKGIIGSYGLIRGAQAYIAFVANNEDPEVMLKAGYVGEAIILELTALGIDTCWIGGFFKPEVVRQQVALRDNEQVVAITPIGYSADQLTITEKLMSTMVKSKKRKEISELCTGLAYDQWADWQKAAVADARVAPSAVNRQPWRFEIQSDMITISTDGGRELGNIAKELDCGIAMLHLEIGSLVSGVQGQWEFLKAPQVARYRINSVS